MFRFGVIILSVARIAFPQTVVAQTTTLSCRSAEQKVFRRLSKDNIDIIEEQAFHSYIKSEKTGAIVKNFTTMNPNDSPTSRIERKGINFTGKKSLALLNSPAIEHEIASIMFKGCPKLATYTFSLHNSGFVITYGFEANGTIKQWECLEDIGFQPGRQSVRRTEKPPAWGYQYCSI